MRTLVWTFSVWKYWRRVTLTLPKGPGALNTVNIGKRPLATSATTSNDVDKTLLQSDKDKDIEWVDKIIYSSYLQKHQPRRSYRYRMYQHAIRNSTEGLERLGTELTSAPLTWKYLNEEEYKEEVTKTSNEADSDDKPQGEEDEEGKPHFPFKNMEPVKFESEAERMAQAGVDIKEVLNLKEDEDEHQSLESWEMVKQECGTPDPRERPSDVPCGGCGAMLHCQDTAIPGYLSSERFKLARNRLRGELCMRCYCLKNFNTALNVNVSAEDYRRVVSQIHKHFAMVLLLVDLTDFPCSIWPGIIDIIGEKRPVFLVGNKVDLIPRDSERHLDKIKEVLLRSARQVGLDRAKIIHTSVISASTGFGVEELISDIHKKWGYKGNIFIMGCTNVGKSSLFNLLLQSDLCKADVADKVQRATISQWPGTTLNLLKFPVLNPLKWRVVSRQNRLQKDEAASMDERIERHMKLRETHEPQHAILRGKVGRTFLGHDIQEEIQDPIVVTDVFAHPKYPPRNVPVTGPGDWDPSSDPALRATKWCYDTPGTVNDNQILDILTLPELIKGLPKALIEPRTFYMKENLSLFVGGLARIDYVMGQDPIRYTVFCSNFIPITIVPIADADDFYTKALGSPVLGVPFGSAERLSQFPPLKPNDFFLQGEGHRKSCGDIVLSSAGWVAVTAGANKSAQLRVHTPDGRGSFLRKPSVVPFAVGQKGPRIRGSLAYLPHRLFIPNKNAKY